MEIEKWKKDETPYFLFACFKCGRMLYVKNIQKTKKCLACNRVHQVAKLPGDTEMVYGISKAIDAVKQRQNALAILENLVKLLSNFYQSLVKLLSKYSSLYYPNIIYIKKGGKNNL